MCEAIAFEGRQLGDGQDLVANVGRLLAGLRRAPGHERFAHDWLARAWRAQRPAQRVDLAAAVAAHLEASDLMTRSGAIRFFQSQRAADDQGALLRALLHDGGRFLGVDDPIPGSVGDLRMELARALANHPQRLRDQATREALRREALRPGMAGGVIAGLFDTDKKWLLENARRIVELTPSAYTVYLLNLALRREQLSAFVRDLSGVVPDEVAEAVARERFESRPELLAACLSALGLSGEGAP